MSVAKIIAIFLPGNLATVGRGREAASGENCLCAPPSARSRSAAALKLVQLVHSAALSVSEFVQRLRTDRDDNTHKGEGRERRQQRGLGFNPQSGWDSPTILFSC